jgi:hypothetical protein
MFALMRDTGLTAGQGARDSRLAYTTQVIGRTIASSNELTIREAGQVIDDLQQLMQLPPEQRQQRFAATDETATLDALEQQLDATPAEPPQEEPPPPADDIPF